MSPLRRKNLSDQIFEMISKKIIRNELSPGEAIYETHISKELGVSRSPVRDAMHMLEKIWLVERTGKGYYQVTTLSAERIQSLYETALILYPYAFARAAERAGSQDLSKMRKTLREIEKSLESNDVEIYLGNVSKMAGLVLKAAKNPLVERIALELMPTAERIQWAAINHLPDQLKTVIGHLRDGCAGIENRNPEKAANAFEVFAAAHIQVVIDSLNGDTSPS